METTLYEDIERLLDLANCIKIKLRSEKVRGEIMELVIRNAEMASNIKDNFWDYPEVESESEADATEEKATIRVPGDEFLYKDADWDENLGYPPAKILIEISRLSSQIGEINLDIQEEEEIHKYDERFNGAKERLSRIRRLFHRYIRSWRSDQYTEYPKKKEPLKEELGSLISIIDHTIIVNNVESLQEGMKRIRSKTTQLIDEFESYPDIWEEISVEEMEIRNNDKKMKAIQSIYL